MGKYNEPSTLAKAGFIFYRATPMGRATAIREYIGGRSRYLHDVLAMCRRGIWERELRQFMPPASLHECVCALLEMGLIETIESPYERLAA